jgi:two-component system, OmpR family, sensor histidine kinase KdpD
VRARQSGGDAGEGSGLGLAIAKGIVDAHRGEIAATSPVVNGRGTAIAIRLPIAEARP